MAIKKLTQFWESLDPIQKFKQKDDIKMRTGLGKNSA
jgi:hypothetical protein